MGVVMLSELGNVADLEVFHLFKHVDLMLDFLFEAFVFIRVVENENSANDAASQKWQYF